MTDSLAAKFTCSLLTWSVPAEVGQDEERSRTSSKRYIEQQGSAVLQAWFDYELKHRIFQCQTYLKLFIQNGEALPCYQPKIVKHFLPLAAIAMLDNSGYYTK